jgi:hypothetical protein
MLDQTKQNSAEIKFANWLPGLLADDQVPDVPIMIVPMQEVIELFFQRFGEYAGATGLENKFPSFKDRGVPVSVAKWEHEKSQVAKKP